MTEVSNLINLEIPIGTTSTGEIFELKLFSRSMMNCFITGCIGSGKSNLLRAIVKNTMKKYSSENINIWLLNGKLSEFNDILPLYPNKLTNIDISSEESIKTIIKTLFDETKNRFKKLIENGVSSYAELKNDTVMSRLLIVVDDFHIVDRILEEDYNSKYMFEEILVTGRAVGISLIITNQTPKCECRGLSPKSKAFIQVLVSLKNIDGFLFEALDVSKQDLSDLEKEKVHDFLIVIGNFAFNERLFDEKENHFVNKITLATAEYVPYQKLGEVL